RRNLPLSWPVRQRTRRSCQSSKRPSPRQLGTDSDRKAAATFWKQARRLFAVGNDPVPSLFRTNGFHARLEDVVAKRRSGRYVPDERAWIKTKKRDYWRYGWSARCA